MRTQLPFALLAAALTCSLFAAPAQAQRARVFVASYGNDSNPCTFGSPCKTFQNAFNNVAVGGEITAIDSAGFGSLNITHAITITSPAGIEAGIVPIAGADAIDINAGSNDELNLRGLTIEGAGIGAAGIKFNIGQSLTVENCVIRHFTGNGIDFEPIASSSLLVSNTFVGDNNNNGIIIFPAGPGEVTAAFNRVEVYNNGNQGILVSGGNSTGTVSATVSESSAAKNANSGFLVTLPGSASIGMTVLHSVSSNNGTGISANGGATATLRIGRSTVTGNTFDWLTTSGGVLLSYGDNAIDGNTNPNMLSPGSLTYK